MKSLMRKYANTVECLEVMHKTTNYALPVSLGRGDTSWLHECRTFVTQFETTEMILEALGTFKECHPSFNLTFWMTDYSLPEVSAISKVFP